MSTIHRPRTLRPDERARDRATHRLFAERVPAPDPVDCLMLARWIRAQLRQESAAIRLSRQSAEQCAALLEGAATLAEREAR